MKFFRKWQLLSTDDTNTKIGTRGSAEEIIINNKGFFPFSYNNAWFSPQATENKVETIKLENMFFTYVLF